MEMPARGVGHLGNSATSARCLFDGVPDAPDSLRRLLRIHEGGIHEEAADPRCHEVGQVRDDIKGHAVVEVAAPCDIGDDGEDIALAILQPEGDGPTLASSAILIAWALAG